MELTAEQIVKRVSQKRGDRGVWEQHWQELADYILPSKDQFVRQTEAGKKKGQYLFDNTAMVSNELLASALHGMLTNPATIWFELSTGDDKLDKDERVAKYLEELTLRTHRVLNNSNFQTEIFEVYVDISAFGTSVMSIEEDDETVVRFHTRHLSECFLEENDKGYVEGIDRCFKWSAQQIVQFFAKGVAETQEALEKKVGKKVADAFMKGGAEKFEVIHSVHRRSLTKETRRPYVSKYVLACENKELRKKYFRTFPYIAPRWTKSSNEVYGRSPGMNALPEAKTLNLMAKTVLKGAQKTIDPPVQLPDEGYVYPFKTAPASINYYRAGSQDRAEPVFNDARIDFGIELENRRAQKIKEAYHIDKLQLMQNDRMTTVEVSQRIEEQLRFLGPMLGRQHSETLRPLIDRVLDIMFHNDVDGDLVGNPPEILSGRTLLVQYSSPIARAQLANQARNNLRALEASQLFFQISPEATDLISADEGVRENWRIFGASRSILKDRAEVEAIREARAQAQQAALEQQQEMLEAEKMNKAGPTAIQMAQMNQQGQGETQ